MCRPPSAAGPSSSDSKSIPNAPLDRYSVCSSNKGKNMNTQDLAEKIAEAQDISKADARKLVDSVIAAIGDAAAAGEEVPTNGFGKFAVKAKPERTGRNPPTGQNLDKTGKTKGGKRREK